MIALGDPLFKSGILKQQADLRLDRMLVVEIGEDGAVCCVQAETFAIVQTLDF